MEEEYVDLSVGQTSVLTQEIEQLEVELKEIVDKKTSTLKLIAECKKK